MPNVAKKKGKKRSAKNKCESSVGDRKSTNINGAAKRNGTLNRSSASKRRNNNRKAVHLETLGSGVGGKKR